MEKMNGNRDDVGAESENCDDFLGFVRSWKSVIKKNVI